MTKYVFDWLTLDLNLVLCDRITPTRSHISSGTSLHPCLQQKVCGALERRLSTV